MAQAVDKYTSNRYTVFILRENMLDRKRGGKEDNLGHTQIPEEEDG